MNFNNVLKNKYLYYVAVALMVINVLGYVSLGSIECVLVLGGAAYLANQFTQNRTVDIFIGLFVSNILFGCGRLREGFVEAMESTGDSQKKVDAKAKKDNLEAQVTAATNPTLENVDHANKTEIAAASTNKATDDTAECEKDKDGKCVVKSSFL